MAADNDEQVSPEPSPQPPVLVKASRRFYGPLSSFEYEVAQLYRAWPKPRVRKDN